MPSLSRVVLYDGAKGADCVIWRNPFVVSLQPIATLAFISGNGEEVGADTPQLNCAIGLVPEVLQVREADAVF
jgi:hypothetical protein